MSKRIFLLILTVGLISVTLGATIAWFHDPGISRDNVFTAGTWTHDIAVINIHLSKTIVGQGYNMCISVTVTNEGTLPETFNLTAYANTTIIETQELNLASEDSTTITFTWNTTGVDYGNYIISAVAATLLGEIDMTDNTYVNGMVFVTIAGDVDGDGDVDMFDFGTFAFHYSTSVGDTRYNSECDLDGDGDVDMFDFGIFAQNYCTTV